MRWLELEHKFCQCEGGLKVKDDAAIAGYASIFGVTDQGGDVVLPGAYRQSLQAMAEAGQRVKMLWQHDPAEPIGLWDEVREDARGLYVKGRLLTDVARGREAVALIAAGALDGLSIGYRTVTCEKDGKGNRLLSRLELWEVSLVTFPMLSNARVGAKGEALENTLLRDLAAALSVARRSMAGN